MEKIKNSKTEEQRCRVLIDNAPEAVVILDVETGQFIDYNQNAADLFRLSGRELLAKGPVEVSPEVVYGHQAADYSQAFIEEALHGGNPVFDWIHQDSEGREISCEVRLIRFPPYDRQLVRASIIDMTDRRNMERILQEREERLQLALRATGLGCFDWQPLSGTLLWDSRMHELFGLSKQSKQDKTEYFFSVLHPEDAAGLRRSYDQAVVSSHETGTLEGEYRIITQGVVRHIRTNALLFRNDLGDLERVIGTCEDVTVDRTRESLLRSTTERLLEAQRVARLGNFETNLTTRTTWWSEGMYRIFELEPDAWVPNREKFMSCVHPADRATINQKIESCIQQGREQRLEYQLQLPGGQTKHMDDIIRPVKDSSGKVVGLVGTSQDITERKRTEAALRTSEAQYRALAENFPNGLIALFDRDLRYTVVNGKGLAKVGLNPADLEGKRLRDVFPPEIFARDEPPLRAALRGETVESVIPFGEEFFRVITLPVKDEQGTVINGMVMSQNITPLKQTELALKNTLEQLQLAVQTAKLGIWRLNVETARLEWNDHLLDIYGLTRTEFEMNLDGWRSQLHPEDRDYANRRLEEIWKGNHVYDVEFRIIRPSGEIRHLNASGSPLFDESGKLTELIGINTDITHIRQKEVALRESEERFRSVFNQQFQFMAILSPTGRTLEINDLPLKVLGFERETYLGEYFWESPAWEHLPDWQTIIKKQVFQAAAMDDPLLAEDTFQTKEGDLRYASSAYSAIRDTDGAVQYILVQATDITERYLAKEKLHQARQDLSEITERLQISTRAAQVGIWDWNIQTDTLVWDDTMFALYGLSRDEFSNTSSAWQARVHPDDHRQNIQNIVHALKGEQEFDTEFRVIWPDQSIHYIRALATVQRDQTGRAVRMLGTNWDITREKEAEREKLRTRQLELKNKELEQFAYVASHDLQEPLRTVIGFVSLLKRGYQNELDGRANEYLDFISQSADRMSKLIKGLLEYSRIGRNRQLTSIDCQALVSNILDDLARRISETRAVIEVGSLPRLRGYDTELRVLFQNLISNAIKFRKENTAPLIRITAQKKAEHWVFSITDNGIGIDERHREKIFVIFQRLHPHNEYEGTGIGLAHCQKIVDLHGGRIWVDSQTEKGSTFHFTIPY